MAHNRLQYLPGKVRGKPFRDPSNPFGCRPANNGILRDIENGASGNRGPHQAPYLGSPGRDHPVYPPSPPEHLFLHPELEEHCVFPEKPTISLPIERGLGSYQVCSGQLTFSNPGNITWRKQPNSRMRDSLCSELPDNSVNLETFGVVDRSRNPQQIRGMTLYYVRWCRFCYLVNHLQDPYCLREEWIGSKLPGKW